MLKCRFRAASAWELARDNRRETLWSAANTITDGRPAKEYSAGRPGAGPVREKRLAARAIMGLARTGSSGSNGSGDYVIAFSTASELRISTEEPHPIALTPGTTRAGQPLGNEAMSPLFLAAIEATEEATYNSLFRATTVTGRGRTVEALPLERTLEILREHGVINK